jgi:hypothetical protein
MARKRCKNNVYFAIVAVVLHLSNIAVTFGDTSGDAMDVREAMVIEATNAITKAYYTIASDGISASICEDVTSYKFPDICMPDEEYEAKYKRHKEDGGTETVTYNDVRPGSGKNAPKNLKENEKFDNVRTGDYLGYKIQAKTPQNSKVLQEVCAAKNVGDTFSNHAKGDTKYGKLAATTSWQYFGGQETGLFAQYPASIKTQCWCDDYDPRYRPWYAAAVTGPKDIILVLDASGSMRDEVAIKNKDGDDAVRMVQRLDIMKEAAIAQLDTVTFSDFIQVVVYSISARSTGNRKLCIYTYIYPSFFSELLKFLSLT